MQDLFNVEELANDAPEPVDPEKVCNFEGCRNDWSEIIEFTETIGKLGYRIPICHKCLHRCQTETPYAERFTAGQKKLIRVYWKSKGKS